VALPASTVLGAAGTSTVEPRAGRG